jgi:hypothetical protein
MAYLYRKNRSPFWYIQYLDSERKKHDKSTGLRADDPNDTAKAKTLRAELEAAEHRGAPLLNGAGWDWFQSSSNGIARHRRLFEDMKTLGSGLPFGCNASESILLGS